MKIKYAVLLLAAAAMTAQPAAAEILFHDVPYYAQGKDSPWADMKIGRKSEATMRTHGCALSCMSMVISYFEKTDFDPAAMNRWLKRHKGYEDAWNGDIYLGEISLRWPALSDFGSGWVYTRFNWSAGPADTLLIRYYLGHGVPVIAEVEYRDAPHYIVLTGWKAETGFEMNDPEFPGTNRFDSVYNASDGWGSGPERNINGIRVIYPAGHEFTE